MAITAGTTAYADKLNELLAQSDMQLVRPEILANFAGVTVRWIQQLTQEGVIQSVPPPEGGPGRRYDFLPAIKAMITYYREKAVRKSEPAAAMEEEKLLHEAAKRELAEMKVAREKGLLYHALDIEKVFGAMLTRLRTGLLSLPLGVAPLLTNQEDINHIAETITDRISHSLTELSKYDFETFAGQEKEYVAELDDLEEEGKTDGEAETDE